LDRIKKAFTKTYLTIDGRSLGVFRIGLALLMLVDLVRRFPHVRDFFTNAGLLPNHTVLWRPQVPRLFSFFFPASLGQEVWLLLAIGAFCTLCLLVGWRTRVFQVLCFLFYTSLHNRDVFTENWGSVAMGALMAWSIFLPTGRRFSVDALLASLRARRDEQPADLAPDRLPPPDERPFVSLAVLGVLLQLAVIYWFNFVHKSGTSWRDGTAIHYVLWQERIITTFGLWAREHAPFAVWKALTHGTLVVESAAPFLILSPFLKDWTRALAIVALTGLHVGIALLVNVGVFSWAMIAYYPLLLTEGHWRFLARLVPKRGRRRTVYYDAGCGVCFQIVRVLARMDVHRRLTWVPNQEADKLPRGVPAELLERTMLVVDPERDRRWTRSDGFAQVFMALPFGRLWAWLLLAPGLRQLAGAGYDAFARNRTSISTAFGLAACGIPGAPPPKRPPEPAEIPLQSWARAQLPYVRELCVALLIVVFAADLSVANAAMPQALRWDRRPQWMAAAVMYPHIFQSWSMFSPDAPFRDYMIYADAVTRDGRHVDPINEVASRVATLPVEDIPRRLGHDSFWCDYQLRIPSMPAYHQALLEWVLRYPERTHREADTLVSFEVWLLEHASPKPGETQPSDIRRRKILGWTQPPPPPPAPAAAPAPATAPAPPAAGAKP
jgi:predicted DCC family thiol-disulfide oxidoreductase YuxK